MNHFFFQLLTLLTFFFSTTSATTDINELFGPFPPSDIDLVSTTILSTSIKTIKDGQYSFYVSTIPTQTWFYRPTINPCGPPRKEISPTSTGLNQQSTIKATAHNPQTTPVVSTEQLPPHSTTIAPIVPPKSVFTYIVTTTDTQGNSIIVTKTVCPECSNTNTVPITNLIPSVIDNVPIKTTNTILNSVTDINSKTDTYISTPQTANPPGTALNSNKATVSQPIKENTSTEPNGGKHSTISATSKQMETTTTYTTTNSNGETTLITSRIATTPSQETNPTTNTKPQDSGTTAMTNTKPTPVQSIMRGSSSAVISSYEGSAPKITSSVFSIIILIVASLF